MDLIYRKAYTFEGPNGDDVTEGPVPADMVTAVEHFRSKLIEAVRAAASCAIEFLTKFKTLILRRGNQDVSSFAGRAWNTGCAVAHSCSEGAGWRH